MLKKKKIKLVIMADCYNCSKSFKESELVWSEEWCGKVCQECYDEEESDDEESEDEDEDEDLLECAKCPKKIVRDSEDHDFCHINGDDELICVDCVLAKKCDCENCDDEEDEDAEYCVKCNAKKPYEYENDMWTFCEGVYGWYCPDHAPTTNCNHDLCECCNPEYETCERCGEEVAVYMNMSDFGSKHRGMSIAECEYTGKMLCRSCLNKMYIKHVLLKKGKKKFVIVN